jgi:hypothetical protein
VGERLHQESGVVNGSNVVRKKRMKILEEKKNQGRR